MSLVGQTVWVVGGVGALGRGIARQLLQAGATVIVNSRSAERLEHIAADLNSPARLVTVHGRLNTPDQAARTTQQAFAATNNNNNNNNQLLHHVVAHGAVRYWTTERAGCDETFSLNEAANVKSFWEQSPADFVANASLLASLHYSAAQALLPLLQQPPVGGGAGKHQHQQQHQQLPPTYTFVTGDGGGHPSTRRSAMGEINSHHVWGLAAAMRQELSKNTTSNVWCREIRVDLPVNPVSLIDQRRPNSLSEDIGELCAGLIASTNTTSNDNGRLLHVGSQQELDALLLEYHADADKSMAPLPHFTEFVGSL